MVGLFTPSVLDVVQTQVTMPTVDQLSLHVRAHSLAKCGQVPMKTAPIRLQRQPIEQKKYTKPSVGGRKYGTAHL